MFRGGFLNQPCFSENVDEQKDFIHSESLTAIFVLMNVLHFFHFES